MSTLRVIVDDVVAPAGITSYAEELARAILDTRPRGADVAVIVPSSLEERYRRLESILPGVELLKSALERPQLAAAWQHGFTVLPGSGMVHATSPLAPLRRHDRDVDPGSQVVVTIHDAIAWTDPEQLAPRTAAWARAMGRRAARHADAVVVPTHSIAAQLDEILGLGDRLRVISGGPGSRRAAPPDAADRRRTLGLPEAYLLAFAPTNRQAGSRALLEAIARLSDGTLVVIGASEGELPLADAAELGLGERVLGRAGLSDDDLGAALDGATAFVQPDQGPGADLALIQALASGLPVVLGGAPALLEIVAEGGLVAEPTAAGGFVEGLADAMRAVLDDAVLRDRLRVAASDRARAFTWRDAAEKVWQLHADL